MLSTTSLMTHQLYCLCEQKNDISMKRKQSEKSRNFYRGINICIRIQDQGTVQYSTVQYSTVQYSTVQYSTVWYVPSDLTRKAITAPTPVVPAL